MERIIVSLKEDVFEMMGGECCHCGFYDYRALQIDHINGGGSKDPNKKGGTQGLYKFILNNPETIGEFYQLLCANCNWIKRYENNEKRKVLYGHLAWKDKKTGEIVYMEPVYDKEEAMRQEIKLYGKTYL